jgi:hypothetical protein
MLALDIYTEPKPDIVDIKNNEEIYVSPRPFIVDVKFDVDIIGIP